MSDLEVVSLFGLGLLALLAVLLLRRKPSPRPPPRPEDNRPAILVDGSNVMHWGGDPSAVVLSRVIDALQAEGLMPYVCFDANAGYKLSRQYLRARDLSPLIGLPEDQILVVDRGMTADEVLLNEAQARGLVVVSNDRFRDWQDRHPWVRNHRRFRRGTWKEGSIMWHKGRQT